MLAGSLAVLATKFHPPRFERRRRKGALWTSVYPLSPSPEICSRERTPLSAVRSAWFALQKSDDVTHYEPAEHLRVPRASPAQSEASLAWLRWLSFPSGFHQG